MIRHQPKPLYTRELPAKSSYGALLFSRDPNSGELGIILGYESSDWYPFKGASNEGESPEQAAIREIYEETAGVVELNQISLDLEFATKRKCYYIGLVEVDYSIVTNFTKAREQYTTGAFAEKTEIKFFPLSQIDMRQFPWITQKCISHYFKRIGHYKKRGYGDMGNDDRGNGDSTTIAVPPPNPLYGGGNKKVEHCSQF